MSATTSIEWTDATWNPVRGCSRVSPGCGGANHQGGCYAEKIAARFSGPGQPFHGLAERTPHGGRWTGVLAAAPADVLLQPLRWKKPRRIFVNSMSDLFHEALPDETINRVFAVMALCPQHTFQVLTKRPQRMLVYMKNDRRLAAINGAIWSMLGTALGRRIEHGGKWALPALPLPNVWLGVSTEDQATADERIPYLLATPAGKRFISAEPLLGPIDLLPYLFIHTHEDTARLDDETDDVISNPLPFRDPALTPLEDIYQPRLDWVIAGGESGGKSSRPMLPHWVRSLRDQCAIAEVPFFFKQWGDYRLKPATTGNEQWPAQWFGAKPPREGDIARMIYLGKKAAGAELDGKRHREFPT